MTMDVIKLNLSRTAYNHFAVLYKVLNDFSYNKNVETGEQLSVLTKASKSGMPLPSGRWGNALAVALEMRFYQGALFMIENAEELEIDLDSVSSEYGGKDVWDVKQTFELSQLGFDMTKIADNDEFYKAFPETIKVNNSNVDAAIEISKLLQDKMKRSSR